MTEVETNIQLSQYFHRDKKNRLLFYSFPSLSKYKEILHFITTRRDGFSENHFHDFNLASHVGDKEENVLKNRLKLAQSVNVPARSFMISQQVHGTDIIIVNQKESYYKESGAFSTLGECDAMITALKGICLLIFIADCVPLLLYDSKKKVIALVHAGWKGTVGLITQKTVYKMQSYFECRSQDIICAIGPSIGPCCYQVGDEVITMVKEVFPQGKHLIHSLSDKGKGYFNLWEANKLQLLECQIPEENIEIAGICTYCNSKLFFSSRKESGHTGRFAAGIMLKNRKSND